IKLRRYQWVPPPGVRDAIVEALAVDDMVGVYLHNGEVTIAWSVGDDPVQRETLKSEYAGNVGRTINIDKNVVTALDWSRARFTLTRKRIVLHDEKTVYYVWGDCGPLCRT